MSHHVDLRVERVSATEQMLFVYSIHISHQVLLSYNLTKEFQINYFAHQN